MDAGVKDNPRDQKARERCHEAFFYNFPHAAIRILVNILEASAVQIDGSTIQ